jgi:hypothetical protein
LALIGLSAPEELLFAFFRKLYTALRASRHLVPGLRVPGWLASWPSYSIFL